jgi:hypothetical protein
MFLALAAAGRCLAADAFCAQLKSVASEAATGFEGVRGVRLRLGWDDGGGDDETRYAATRTLPGAVGCGVDRDHADGEDVIASYLCWFPAPGDPRGVVRRTGEAVSACLGPRPGDRLATGGQAFDFDRPDFAISIAAGGPSTVVLAISRK